jgi:phosphoribosyl 1,2-cyclic phosphodiesterase
MEIKVLASGSSGNCYRISDGVTSLLLDAGIPIRQIWKGCDFRLSEIRGCLVTHYHSDHSKAVRDLLRYGVPVYMTTGESNMLKKPLVGIRDLRLEPGQDTYPPLDIGSFVIVPFPVEHDTPEPVGFLIGSRASGEKLIYFTDTYYLRFCAPGLTHIIGECNYDPEIVHEKMENGETSASRASRLFTSHASLDTFLVWLRANDLSKLQQIYICHMSNDHGNESKIKEAVQRITGAEVYVC